MSYHQIVLNQLSLELMNLRLFNLIKTLEEEPYTYVCQGEGL